ncbi:helix-turn-helix transcriptional regulator [Dyadobacter bucti]|uniref:helix-turn-helix transcriptional regulator n=1 Tax=Dyadobacter bucti TaxID=2572203 RepID=UPI001109D0D3|nr:AraC family transcriptional regulator [Dyadobacter bucti]
MVFEFVSSGGPGFMTAFAESIGSKIENGILRLPEKLGRGHIKAMDLDPMIRMIVVNFVLKEDLTLKRISAGHSSGGISMTFHNIFHGNRQRGGTSIQDSGLLPSVQVTSADIAFETFFPAHTEINTIIIAVDIDFLRSLLKLKNENSLIENILSGNHSYLYEEIISLQMQEVAAKIVDADVPADLNNFYFKLRAQELIYFLFAELLKREHVASQPLNTADVNVMFAIKNKILADLSQPPNLPELAKSSGMSESKMKRLFKHIFGNSIYNYYQTFRMNEAAYLISERNLSISEVGYRLGFSNLSHFTRLFEKHIGMKPKKYAGRNLKR